jgi:hypothetical protein
MSFKAMCSKCGHRPAHWMLRGLCKFCDLVSQPAGHAHLPDGHRPANWPQLSDAVGTEPSNIPEMREKMAKAGVPTEYHPETGQAILRDRGHRKAVIRAMGLVDKRGGYGD